MVDKTETGLPRAVAIAWGMHEVPQRGPSRGLSHERIVAAGIELADAEGLQAVTMQRVAESLGFTTMSLYRYVSGKDELLELMLDAAAVLPEGTVLDDDWRVALRQWSALVRDAMEAHPWMLSLQRTQVGLLMPNSVGVADLGLQALQGLDIPDEQRVAVILMVSQHVMAMVGLGRDLLAEGVVEYEPEAYANLGEVVTPERFPALAPLLLGGGYVMAGVAGDSPERSLSIEAEYEFGLDLIIAGLEAVEAQRRR